MKPRFPLNASSTTPEVLPTYLAMEFEYDYEVITHNPLYLRNDDLPSPTARA